MSPWRPLKSEEEEEEEEEEREKRKEKKDLSEERKIQCLKTFLLLLQVEILSIFLSFPIFKAPSSVSLRIRRVYRSYISLSFACHQLRCCRSFRVINKVLFLPYVWNTVHSVDTIY